MEENLKLETVSCIVPRKMAKVVSEVIYLDGTRAVVPVRPITIIKWIAWKNYIDFRRVVARSRELNFLRKGVPLPVGIRDAFMPVHLVEEMEQGNVCYGYCNAANQIIDVLPMPHENRRSLLMLQNGIELLVDMGPAIVSSYLSRTVATHRRFINELMKGTSGPYPSAI